MALDKFKNVFRVLLALVWADQILVNACVEHVTPNRVVSKIFTRAIIEWAAELELVEDGLEQSVHLAWLAQYAIAPVKLTKRFIGFLAFLLSLESGILRTTSVANDCLARLAFPGIDYNFLAFRADDLVYE